MGGLSIQPRHALPQAREAIFTGIASGSAHFGSGARPLEFERISLDCISRGHPLGGRESPSHPSSEWPLVGGGVKWCKPDNREDIFDGQVCPDVLEDVEH